MYRDLFSCCFLAFIAGASASQTPAAEEPQMPGKVESVTLAVEGIEAKAEDIHLDVEREGTRKLRLSGKAFITIGDLRATADMIEVSFTTKASVVVQLDGNVQVQDDETRATAHSAKLDATAALLELHGSDGRPATMLRQIGNGASRIEAQNIRFDGKKRMIEVKGSAAINECPDEEPW